MDRVRFQDYFSRVSGSYARYRPTYPPALFEMVARYAPALDCAWDCATGSCQAPVRSKSSRPRRSQRGVSGCACQVSGLDTASVDAVTVAQALQWFDRDRFTRKCGPCANPEPILAVSCYAGRFSFSAEVDAVTKRLNELFMDYWPAVYDDIKSFFDYLDRAEYRDKLFSALRIPLRTAGDPVV